MINFNKSADVVRIVAPASRPNSSDAFGLLHDGIRFLESKGFRVHASERVLSKEPYLFYANTLEERLFDFQEALLDQNVKIIWSLRGGYGSAEIANSLLDFKPTSPKLFVGFSDMTSIHTLFNNYYQLPSLHANGVLSCLRNPFSFEEIINVIQGEPLAFDLTALNYCALDLDGVIVGGNLKVLSSLIGTPLAPNFDDKILILEDVNEPGYAIMRDLMHLKYSGLLAKVKAIVFADFTQGDALVDQVIAAFSNDIKIPAFRAAGFGHGLINTPVMLGSVCCIKDNILTVNSI